LSKIQRILRIESRPAFPTPFRLRRKASEQKIPLPQTPFFFARLLCPAKRGWGQKSVSAIPASAGRQNRKIFVSLIGKILGAARLKNVKKIFLFCSAVRRKETLGGISARQDRNCCSKKVRTSSSNCDQ